LRGLEVEVGVGGEDAEPVEQRPLVLVEQFVAVVDRGCVPGTAGCAARPGPLG
jgi:hypothetical protein